MAAADVTAFNYRKQNTIQSYTSPFERFDYVIDSQTSDGAIDAADTHALITIPTGYTMVMGYFHVNTAFDSAGDGATVQMLVNSVAASGAITEASLATAGNGFVFGGVGTAGTTATGSSGNISWAIGTEALTAGVARISLFCIQDYDGQTS